MDANFSSSSALLVSIALAIVMVPARTMAMILSPTEMEPLKLEQNFLTYRHSLLIAQVTEVTPIDDNGVTRLDISGGTRAGDNLFHSFEQFGVDADQIVNFISQPGIQNILSRVIGGDPSIINGVVTVTGGEPNLFLMNPSGIIIGNDARLDVPADFFVTTATGIEFESGLFSASGENNYDLLVGTPTGFRFNFEDPEIQPGIIINTGEFSGNTLSLIGGFILTFGRTTSEQSSISAIPVPGENLVRISQPGNLLSLEIEPPNQEVASNLWSIPILELPELLTLGNGANALETELINTGDRTAILIFSLPDNEFGNDVLLPLIGIDVPSDVIGPSPDDPIVNPVIIPASDDLSLPPPNPAPIPNPNPAPTPNPNPAPTPNPIPNSISSVLDSEISLNASSQIDFANIERCQGYKIQGLAGDFQALNYPLDERSELDRVTMAVTIPGDDCFRLGYYPQALNLYRSAFTDAQVNGNSVLQAVLLGKMGNISLATGDYKQAVEHYQQQLYLANNGNVSSVKNTALANLGNAYLKLHEYDTALNLYQQVLADAKLVNNEALEATTLVSLGVAELSMSRFSEAIAYQQQALEKFRRLDNPQGEAGALINLGLVYFAQGRFSLALEQYEQGLSIAYAINDPSIIVSSLGNLGVAYQLLGQYDQSLSLLHQQLEMAKAIGDRQREANALGSIGSVHNLEGQYEQAIELFKGQLLITKEIGDRAGEARSHNNIGESYRHLGQFQQAVKAYEKSLAIWADLDNQRSEAITIGNLGLVYTARNQFLQAMNHHQQALALKRRVGDREGERLTLSEIGDLLVSQGQKDLAIIFYKQSINVSETIRTELQVLPTAVQQSYTEEVVSDTYRSLIDLLLEQDRILEAQQVLELLKIEEIREFIRANWTADGIQYDPIEQRIVDAHNSLIALGVSIADCHPNCAQALYDEQISLERYYDFTVKMFRETVVENRAADDVFYDPTSLSTDARELVEAQDGTVLIYPVVQDDRLWLLWTTAGGVVGSVEVPSVTKVELSRTVFRFRELLQDPSRESLEELKQVGHQLYGWLVEPLAVELEKNNIHRLVFAQDRTTRYLPMAALYDGEQFLAETYTISTVLSAALTDINNSLGDVHTARALGLGVDQGIDNYTPLPYVAEELDVVVREDETDPRGIYSGKVLMNQDFTFDRLSRQVRHYNILHIATHAEFVPNIRDASYILSGLGEKLTIADIGSLDSQFENLHLVVLSACQTALGGASLDGTEIAGVSSFFLGKGKADAVLASLWKVSDSSTSLLMQRFYENLAGGNLSKAEALQAAQLSLLQGTDSRDISSNARGAVGIRVNSDRLPDSTIDFSHPYYWAPFILIGNSL
ncbi:MAG: tetratricopeptide repeat protein [Cyanobacteria bacterium P01_F01_bin.150]